MFTCQALCREKWVLANTRELHRALAVQLADGIDVGDELVAISNGAAELDLQIAAGIPNSHPVILDKSRQQVDPLLKHLIPGFALGGLQGRILVLRPGLEKRAARIFTSEERSQCLLGERARDSEMPCFSTITTAAPLGAFLLPSRSNARQK